MATFRGQGSKKIHAGAGTKVTRHQGKGSTQERLPSRFALNKITGGDESDRSMNEYAKATPNIQEGPDVSTGGGPMGGVGPNDYSLG